MKLYSKALELQFSQQMASDVQWRKTVRLYYANILCTEDPDKPFFSPIQL